MSNRQTRTFGGFIGGSVKTNRLHLIKRCLGGVLLERATFIQRREGYELSRGVNEKKKEKKIHYTSKEE